MNKNLPKWLWSIITWVSILVIGYFDWITGYELNFSFFYFIPISLSAWYVGLRLTIALTVFSALVLSGADILSGHVYSSNLYVVWNTLARLVSFLLIGWLVFRMREILYHEREVTDQLRRTLSEVKVLEAFLPICARCKKIRNQQGEWQQMEVYIGQHSNTQFSHGYCPDCARKIVEESGIINKK